MLIELPERHTVIGELSLKNILQILDADMKNSLFPSRHISFVWTGSWRSASSTSWQHRGALEQCSPLALTLIPMYVCKKTGKWNFHKGLIKANVINIS